MKIGNKEEKINQGMQLNDKDYLTCMLTIQKALVKNYAVSLTEASCDNLNDTYHEFLNEANEVQRKIYNLMFRKGFYQLELAKESSVTEKVNTFDKDLKELK